MFVVNTSFTSCFILLFLVSLPLFLYFLYSYYFLFISFIKENPYDVVANVLDCDIVLSKLELHSRYYVHFRTNNIWSGMNSLFQPTDKG